MAKSIAQRIHELSQDGGLHDHSTGQQIRDRLMKEHGAEFVGDTIRLPDGSELKERQEWRVRQGPPKDYNSMEAELRDRGYKVPVLYVTKEATRQEATITTPDGKSHTVYVPK
jgi:hypothetical protein